MSMTVLLFMASMFYNGFTGRYIGRDVGLFHAGYLMALCLAWDIMQHTRRSNRV